MDMQIDTSIPPPRSLADQLRDIPVGASVWFDSGQHSETTVRSTLTRVKREDRQRQYTTRPERAQAGEGLRVWRLA